LALGYGLEEISNFLGERNQKKSATHIVFESRGKKEDAELECEFNQFRERNISLPFEILFADKKINSSGLQLADLVARPIGRYVMNPTQPNRAFTTIKSKLYCYGNNTNKKHHDLIIYP